MGLAFALLLALAGGVMVVCVLDVLDLVPRLERRRPCDVAQLCTAAQLDPARSGGGRLTAIDTLAAARLLPASARLGGPIARGPCRPPSEQVLARHYRRSHFDYWGEAEVLSAALGTRT